MCIVRRVVCVPSLFVFALKKTRASGRNVGKVFNPVVKLVLENQPFLCVYSEEGSVCLNGSVCV